MQLVLVLPGLLAACNTAATPIRAPALAHLLAEAGMAMRNAEGLGAAIATCYSIERQTDWPLAAIRVAALGVDPTDAYWLAADPVTLTVGRDDVEFAGVVDDLAQADADALVATLNAHFAADGLTFVAPLPDAMFARRATPPRLSTLPPAVVPEQPLRLRLPTGPDAGAWRRWQSEIQMLLHDHPVNAGRERAGRPTANSVWFSSGGTLPPSPAPAPSIRTFANAGIAVALAAHAGSPASALPAGLADAFDDAPGAELIVAAIEPRAGLAEVDTLWAKPARDALVAGRLAAVTLLAEDAGDAVTWRAGRPGLWQRLAGRVKRHDLAALIAAAGKRQ